MVVEREHPLKQREAMALMAQRRPREFPVILALVLLAIPVILVTVAMPLLWQVELWYVLIMDLTFVAIFLIWRAYIAIGKWFSRVRSRSNIQRLQAGDALIRWTYSADEWRHFAAHEYRRDRRISGAFMPLWSTLLSSVIFAGIVAGAMLLANSSETSGTGTGDVIPREAIAGVAALAFAIPLFYKAVQSANLYLGDRQIAAERTFPPEILLNAAGLLGAPGGYLALDPEETAFETAEEDGIPLLLVHWRHTLSGRMFNLSVSKVERVLIPRGRESDALALVKKSPST